jgi:hypothetical protein
MECGSISSSALILNFTPAGNEREERKNDFLSFYFPSTTAFLLLYFTVAILRR